ncbi:MAG: hypothetical protein M3Z32_10520 [Acidobacteriota bacterium]|nr:hypothetical protein [Acidobacteriota bacterium]
MLSKMLVTLGFATFGAIFTAQAGPPLICHPYDIGGAPSLPWGSNAAAGWDNPDPSYSVQQLSADTLRLLDDKTPVLVRMETLRRAAIYGEKDHRAATELLSALRKRADGGNTRALFDYGYFVETVKQMQWRYKDDITHGVDGSAFVTKALSREPASVDMRKASDVIASSKPMK